MKVWIARAAMTAIAVVLLGATAMAAPFTAEVFLHIPGDKPVHCMEARVSIEGNGIVVVQVPWGITYTTHIANVVIVERRQGTRVR